MLVLRDGEPAGDAPIGALTRQRMIELMVGRQIQNEFPKHHHPVGKTRLAVERLCRGTAVRDVSFAIRRGRSAGAHRV